MDEPDATSVTSVTIDLVVRGGLRGPLPACLRRRVPAARPSQRGGGRGPGDPGPCLRAVAQDPGLRRGVGRAGRRQPGDRRLAAPPRVDTDAATERRGATAPGPDGQRVDLHRALDTLSRRQREVIVLRFLADLPEADVAKALGCSVGSVKQHASRGLAALRTTMAVDDAARHPGALMPNLTDSDLRDPSPPVPGDAQRAAVAARAHQLGRRRRMMQGVGALGMVAAVAVGVAALTAGGTSGPGASRIEAAGAPRRAPHRRRRPTVRPVPSPDPTPRRPTRSRRSEHVHRVGAPCATSPPGATLTLTPERQRRHVLRRRRRRRQLLDRRRARRRVRGDVRVESARPAPRRSRAGIGGVSISGDSTSASACRSHRNVGSANPNPPDRPAPP